MWVRATRSQNARLRLRVSFIRCMASSNPPPGASHSVIASSPRELRSASQADTRISDGRFDIAIFRTRSRAAWAAADLTGEGWSAAPSSAAVTTARADAVPATTPPPASNPAVSTGTSHRCARPVT